MVGERSAWLGALVCLSALTSSAPLFAQTGAEVTARNAALVRAREAAERGDQQTALDMAQRALRIAATPSVRFFVAERLALLGRTGPALGEATLCAREAEHDPTVRNRESITSACRALAEQMQPRVGHVLVVTASPTPGLQVTIGGERVPETLLGLPYVVTPGAVRVEVQAPGFVPYVRELTLAARETQRIEVALTPEPTAAPELPPTPEPPPPPPPPPPEPPRPRYVARPRSYAGPVIVTASGAAIFGLAGVFGALQSNALSDFERTYCGGLGSLRCVPGSEDQLDPARTYTLLANVSIGVGAAATTAGAAWLLYTALAPARLEPVIALVPSATGATLTFTMRGGL